MVVGPYFPFRYWILTEKMRANTQRHNRQHNDAKVTSLGSLLGLPVELSNGITVQTKHKTTIKLTYTGDLLVSKLAVWVPCTGNRAQPCITVVVGWYKRDNIIWIYLVYNYLMKLTKNEVLTNFSCFV